MEVFDGNASAVHTRVQTRSGEGVDACGFRERAVALRTVETWPGCLDAFPLKASVLRSGRRLPARQAPR